MLEVRNISFEAQGRALLKNVDYVFDKPLLYFIGGVNGAGKTSFLKVVTGEIKSIAGEVILRNRSLNDFSPKELALLRAYLPQELQISFPIRCGDLLNLAKYSTPSIDSSVWHSVKNEVSERLGLHPILEKHTHQISGGEKKRLLLAKSILQLLISPISELKFLFLDEPLASLDVKFQVAVLNYLTELKRKNIAIIAVMHDLAVLQQYSDQLLLFKDGKLKVSGDPKTVFTSQALQKLFDVRSDELPHLAFI